MQPSSILRGKRKHKYLLTLLIKLIITSGLFAFILGEFDLQTIREQSIEFASSLNEHGTYIPLIAAVILMPINWSLESTKWRLLLRPVAAISYANALKGVLSGIATGFFTPNRIGEFAGRIIHMDRGDRIEGTLASLVGSFAQLTITLVTGLVCLSYWFLAMEPLEAVLLNYLTAFSLILAAALTFYLFLTEGKLTAAIRSISFLPKQAKSYLKVAETYTHPELLKILGLSFGRFVIFTGQLALLLSVFGFDIDLFIGLIVLPLVFFIQTVIPSVTIGEAGLREFVSITVLGYFGSQHPGILMASTALWLLNLVIPALIGSGLILNARLIRKSRS